MDADAQVGVTLRWDGDQALDPEIRQLLTGPGAPLELADVEVLGTTMRSFVARAPSVREWLLAAGDRFGDTPFLVFPDRTVTYRSILPPVVSVARALQDRYGVAKGDRVALCSANVAEHPIAAWAAVLLGAVVVELNGWWTGPELRHGIELTEPSVILGDARRLARLDPGAVSVPVVAFDDPSGLDRAEDFSALEAHAPDATVPKVDIAEDDPLVVLFTSGTTGRPKGATLSHRGHVHMMMQAALQGASRALSEGIDPRGGRHVTIGVSPMFHISGFTTQVIGGTYFGGTWVYPPPGAWREDVHLELSQRYQATAWSIVPTQLWRLLDYPGLDDYDLSSLRRVGGGGSTFQPELWRRVAERLPQVARMSTGYGMSETCGAGTLHDGPDTAAHPDAVGRPGPGMEIQVRDPLGRVLPEGEVGQIHLRGATVMLGYWADPEATKAAIDADRWYATGELGHIAGGLLYLDGRGSDLIVRGGENVYPIEIENRLVEHPDIAEAAVIGEDDRVLGQRVVAVVVRREGSALGEADVQSWVAEALARFKVPSEVHLVGALPHNAAGKVVKQQIGTTGEPVEEE